MSRCTQVTDAPRLSNGSWEGLTASADEEPRAEVTAAEFRHAIGHFATGVTIVTAIGADGEPVGTTANAVTSLSLDPPLLLVCFDRSSVTLRAIRHRGAFVVNVLAAPQRHLSANFARRGPTATWDDVRHHAGLTGSPRLDGVLAAIECAVEERLPGGDHEIIIGRVHDVETNGKNAAPLLFWCGRYGTLIGAAGQGSEGRNWHAHSGV